MGKCRSAKDFEELCLPLAARSVFSWNAWNFPATHQLMISKIHFRRLAIQVRQFKPNDRNSHQIKTKFFAVNEGLNTFSSTSRQFTYIREND